MSEVAVKIKVMPKSIDTDLSLLGENIRKILPKGSKIYGDYKIEPIAFGLNSLILTILINDDKGEIDSIENAIKNVSDVENIQILEMGRI